MSLKITQLCSYKVSEKLSGKSKKIKTDQCEKFQARSGYIQIKIKDSRKKATLTTH